MCQFHIGSHSNLGMEKKTKMKFIHEPYDFPKINRVTTAEGRVYQSPTGEKYPSITTILSADKEKKKGIEKWKARVGEAEAKRIVKKAAVRGTSLHTNIENYLIEGTYDKSDPFSLFPSVKPFIDKNITKVFNLEAGVYSHRLKAAGTFDCFAEWGGVPSLIDWKSAKQLKKREWIRTYLWQATFYSMAIWEMKKIKVPQIVILIGVDHEHPQLFIEKASDYIEPVCAAIKQYHKEHSL